jgi:hypothetical protein
MWPPENSIVKHIFGVLNLKYRPGILDKEIASGYDPVGALGY